MNEKLSLKERFLLLALDDEQGVLIHENTSFLIGFTGAVLYKMLVKNLLFVENNQLKFKPVPLIDSCHRLIRRKLKRHRHAPELAYFLNILYPESNRLKRFVLAQLQKKEVVSCKKKKLLGIFTINIYPTLKQIPEMRLRKYLQILANENRKPDEESLILFQLIEQCELVEEVFGRDQKDKTLEYIHQLKAQLNTFSEEIQQRNRVLLQAMKSTSLSLVLHNG